MLELVDETTSNWIYAAAAVGRPHDIKGEAVAVFVTLSGGFDPSAELRKELQNHVRKEIGALAVPDDIHFTTSLPKTRSGKIMRRLLRDIAAGREKGEVRNDAEGIETVKTLASNMAWLLKRVR